MPRRNETTASYSFEQNAAACVLEVEVGRELLSLVASDSRYGSLAERHKRVLRSHLPGAGSRCLGGLHGWGELSCQPPPARCAAVFTEHSFLSSTSPTLYDGMLSGPDFSLVLSHPKVTSEWVAPRFRFRVKNRRSS